MIPFVVCFLFRTFTETFHSLCPEKPWVTKLSSAGLVYVHFGRQLLAELTKLKEQDRELEVLYDKVNREQQSKFTIDSSVNNVFGLLICQLNYNCK